MLPSVRSTSLCWILTLSLAAFHAANAWAAEDPSSGPFGRTSYGSLGSAPSAGSGARGAPKDDGVGQFTPVATPTIRNTAPAPASASAASTARPEQGKSVPQHDVDPPSEFQKFVESSTGKQLPAFGNRFFKKALAGFSTPDSVPVSADYIVGNGDEVFIRAWGSIDIDYRVIVDRSGQIHLPKVGSFTVAGIKASDLEKQLRAQIGKLFTNFSLSATLGKLKGIQVFVVGPAHMPGVYTVPSQSTLLSAVVAAGGPSARGSMRKVLLRRDNKVISELDIYDFLVQGDKSKDSQLAAGDVVVFQPAGARVALTGAFDMPSIYELKLPQEPVREVLRYAGGSSVLTNPHQVQVERIDVSQSGASRFVEEFKLDAAGLQKPLRDGDVLTLLSISHEFANAVTLRGPVAQPLRYAYKPKMRIKDLLPNREALISPDFHRRKNLLVQMPEPSNRAPQAGLTPTELEKDPLAAELSKDNLAALFDELNWDYAVIHRLDPTDLSTKVIPFNLGKVVLQGDEAHNLELQPGDVVTVYSQKDIRVPVAKQTRLVTVEGEVAVPGLYQTLPGETLPQLLNRAGGLTPQAYLFGIEFSREETRRRQRVNLAEAIIHLEALARVQSARDSANKQTDATDGTNTASNAATQVQIARLSKTQPNGRIALELTPESTLVSELPEVPLENLDRIVVPTRPGFISIAGAVVGNNALLWKDGRTVEDYIQLAGLDMAAEPSHTFVLRADGTVLTNRGRGFLGMGGLSSMKLAPGDAIIVPNKLDYETWGRALVRSLKDWSQILSQFGLGAAAIQTLRR